MNKSLSLSLSAGILASCALSSVSLHAQANLILNGSFEDSTIDAKTGVNVGVGDPDIFNWEIFDGSVDYISSATWDPSDGTYSLDLDGLIGDAGGVRQTITTIPGQDYEVRFDLAGNVATADPTIKTMRVSADSQSADFTFDITGRTTTSMGWTEHLWIFTADDTSATIALESTADEIGGFTPGWGAALDNVRVVAIPEISTMPALLLFGLLMWRIGRP